MCSGAVRGARQRRPEDVGWRLGREADDGAAQQQRLHLLERRDPRIVRALQRGFGLDRLRDLVAALTLASVPVAWLLDVLTLTPLGRAQIAVTGIESDQPTSIGTDGADV